jgi:hypothetical protein
MVNAAFLAAKLCDIGLVTVYYFFAAICLSWVFNRGMGPFDESEYEQRSTFSIILEVLLQFFILGILTYGLRNLVERIPFPLEGLGGYQHIRLKEIDDAVVFTVVFLFYQDHLAMTLKYLAKRLLFVSETPDSASHNRSGLGKFI